MPSILPNRAKRRRALSLTSLIDVIFLLLLFFMLSSTFSKYAEVELATGGGRGETLSDSPPLFLRLGPDMLSLNGTVLALNTVADALAELDISDTARPVLVSLNGAVTAQRLVDLLAVLRTVPGIAPIVLGAS